MINARGISDRIISSASPCSLESEKTFPALSLRLVWLLGTVKTEAVGTQKSIDDSCRPGMDRRKNLVAPKMLGIRPFCSKWRGARGQ
eukprot:2760923-Rhodomonas_salina.3